MTAQSKKILLVEDDPNLGLLLEENLEMQGYTVSRCPDGASGSAAISTGGFDLCILDIMLPQKDGFALARELRNQDDQTPIIFLTAKALKEDRIAGFRAGADDYVTKPFSLEELLLRIRAILKRSQPEDMTADRQQFRIGSFVFDYNNQCLHRNNATQKLTARESELLLLLCQHRNSLLPRQSALEKIWGADNFFNGRSMDVFISRLRKQLREDKRIEIRTIHAKGYKLLVHDNEL